MCVYVNVFMERGVGGGGLTLTGRVSEDEDGLDFQLQSKKEENPPTGNQHSTPHGLLR